MVLGGLDEAVAVALILVSLFVDDADKRRSPQGKRRFEIILDDFAQPSAPTSLV